MEAQPPHFHNGFVPPNGGHVSFVDVGERPQFHVVLNHFEHVLRKQFRLLDGNGSHHRMAFGPDRRHVAHGKNVRHALHAQEFVYLQPVVSGVRYRRQSGHRRPFHPRGPNHGARAKGFAGGKLYHFAVVVQHPLSQPQLHPHGGQVVLGNVGGFGRKTGQNARPGFNQGNLHQGSIHLLVFDPEDVLPNFGQGPRHFHPRGSSPYNDEVQSRLPIVVLEVEGVLKFLQEVRPDVQGLGNGFELQGIFLQGRVAKKVGLGAGGYHQVVVLEYALVGCHVFGVRVYGKHLGLAESHVGHFGNFPPEGKADVVGRQRTGGHLVQQRLEGVEVVLVNQQDLDGLPGKLLHQGNSGEPASQNNDGGAREAVQAGRNVRGHGKSGLIFAYSRIAAKTKP